MKTIFKYTLDPGGDNTIVTAGMGRILHVAPSYTPEFAKEFGVPDREKEVMAERVTIWCEVDTDREQFTHFEIYGTGHPVKPARIYGGTAVMPSGLVWHVFVPSTDVQHLR